MLREKSFGIIPVYKNQVLLVRHGKGHWALPKGHGEKDETPEQTARRELAEETGIKDVELDNSKTFEEHYFFKQNGESISKSVTYFVGKVSSKSVKIQPAEISDYAWLSFDEAIKKATFKETQKILEQAQNFLQQS